MAEIYDKLSLWKAVGMMLLFVLIGFPLVGLIWETLNELLALKVNSTRILITIPALLILVGLLYVMARSVRKWQDVHQD